MNNLSKRDSILVTLTIAIVIYIIVGLIAKNVFHIDSYFPEDEPLQQTFKGIGDSILHVDEGMFVSKDTLTINRDTITNVELGINNDSVESVYNLTIRVQGNKITGIKLDDQ
nr:hypothetical protein [uncultured Draconibacterium sp.]